MSRLCVAERLQGGDLFALRVDRPAHDDVQQEGRDADEDGGKYFRTGLELLEFLVQQPVGYLVLAAVGAESAVALHDPDPRRAGRRSTSASGWRVRTHAVERPVHVVGLAEGLAAHPENAVVLEIRAHRLRLHQQHELRREGDAGDRQPLPFAVDDRRKGIAEVRSRAPGQSFH